MGVDPRMHVKDPSWLRKPVTLDLNAFTAGLGVYELGGGRGGVAKYGISLDSWIIG